MKIFKMKLLAIFNIIKTNRFWLVYGEGDDINRMHHGKFTTEDAYSMVADIANETNIALDEAQGDVNVQAVSELVNGIK